MLILDLNEKERMGAYKTVLGLRLNPSGTTCEKNMTQGSDCLDSNLVSSIQ